MEEGEEAREEESIAVGLTLQRNQLGRSAAVGLGQLARTVSSLRALDVSHNQVKTKRKKIIR